MARQPTDCFVDALGSATLVPEPFQVQNQHLRHGTQPLCLRGGCPTTGAGHLLMLGVLHIQTVGQAWCLPK